MVDMSISEKRLPQETHSVAPARRQDGIDLRVSTIRQSWRSDRIVFSTRRASRGLDELAIFRPGNDGEKFSRCRTASLFTAQRFGKRRRFYGGLNMMNKPDARSSRWDPIDHSTASKVPGQRGRGHDLPDALRAMFAAGPNIIWSVNS